MPIEVQTTSGQTVYVILKGDVSQEFLKVVSGTASLEAFNSADWTAYAISATWDGVSCYVANIPSGSPAESYIATAFIQAGGSPATTDTQLPGATVDYWNGTAEVTMAALPAAKPNLSGGLPTIGTGSGQINPDGTGAVPIAFGTALSSAPTANTVGESLFLMDWFRGRENTAQGGTSTTITLDSGGSSDTNAYVGDDICLYGGTGGGMAGGGGQRRTIIAYNTSTKVATVNRAWDTTPDNTSKFFTVPGLGIPTNGIAPAQSFNNGGQTANLPANALQWNGVNVTGMPMPTFTQPTGFLAATFPGTVSSYAGGAVASVTGSVGSIAGVTFPNNFGILSINGSGNAAADVQTIKTQAVTSTAGFSFDAQTTAQTNVSNIASGTTVIRSNDYQGNHLAPASAFPANFSTLVITSGQTIGTSSYAGGAVLSVTGNVGGNVTGSVGSVAGSVTGDVQGKVLGGGTSTIAATGADVLVSGYSTGEDPATLLSRDTTYLDAIAAAVEGSGGGPVAINTNTGGTDNLRYVNSSGQGVSGANILIYLAIDWPANPANVQAVAVTGSDGRWLAPAFVSHGTYVAIFTKIGADGPDVSPPFTI
jgi:hypothetical protein